MKKKFSEKFHLIIGGTCGLSACLHSNKIKRKKPNQTKQQLDCIDSNYMEISRLSRSPKCRHTKVSKPHIQTVNNNNSSTSYIFTQTICSICICIYLSSPVLWKWNEHMASVLWEGGHSYTRSHL